MMDEDRSDFFDTDEFGETATYAGTSINVVEYSTDERNTAGVPYLSQSIFTIMIDSDDVAYPRPGDVVTFRGFTCKVGDNPRSEGKVWIVDLEKDLIQI